MAVYSPEDDPLPVELHQPVLHLKPPEPRFLRDHFTEPAVPAIHFDQQVI